MVSLGDDGVDFSVPVALPFAADVLGEPLQLVALIYLDALFLQGLHDQLPFFIVHFEQGHIFVSTACGHSNCLPALGLVHYEISLLAQVLQ